MKGGSKRRESVIVGLIGIAPTARMRTFLGVAIVLCSE